MQERYQHTQIGWVIIFFVLVAAAFMVPALAAANLGLGSAIFLTVLALVMLLFSTLTVTVRQDEICLRFGIGIIRKRIPLDSVRLYRQVRNHWYYGWGIRYIPGGMLWNVSGLHAVELLLKSGKRLRIGTDEPEALSRAIQKILGEPETLSEKEREQENHIKHKGAVSLLVITLGLILLIGGMFYFQMQPPKVTVKQQEFSVSCLFYGDTYYLKDVTEISLQPELPKILARTNGFAVAGTLRGYFSLEGLGQGKLFIERKASPYILIRARNSFVIINFRQKDKTQALFDELTTMHGRI